MIRHVDIEGNALHEAIRSNQIRFAGNIRLHVYGHLHCSSGKRLKRENRVFFNSVSEAKMAGYRPCGRCMRNEYRVWKKETTSSL